MTKHLFIISLLIPCFAFSQYDAIVFEGAGIRGIAYCGVIRALEKDNKMDEIRKFGGTSAGAITAMLLSIGYTSSEIESELAVLKLDKFNSKKGFVFGALARMNKQYGWYKTDELKKWLKNLILRKTGNAEIRLKDLPILGYGDLYCVATCLNKQSVRILSKDTYPEMKVYDAVAISCSIPWYFEAAFVDELGQVYDTPAPNRDVLVDGGIIANYPIFIFDEFDEEGNRIRNNAVLGVRIDDGLWGIEVPLQSQKTIENVQDFSGAVYTVMIETANSAYLSEADRNRTIIVSSCGVGPKVRNLKSEDRVKLIQEGYHACSCFLSDVIKT
ncbi:MAG: hypothetical protein RL226_137 [Bacteroidota bacterium]|jgi:NTE family protein